MASAGDIPHKFDLVVNSEGYVLADSEQQKAVLGYTSPFIPRTSVQSGSSGQPGYGDSDTEFFQTFTQKDWSKGEQQRYQGRDEDSVSRYWVGTNANIGKAGQATIRAALNSITFDDAIVTDFTTHLGLDFYAASDTNLLRANGLTDTDHGAHGAGAAPSRYGLATDGVNVFITGDSCTAVRKWDGSAFSEFSAEEADALVFNNNTLYGYRYTEGDFVRYSTAGALTSLFTWQEADGTALPALTRLLPFGGKVMIVRRGGGNSPTLWLFDGTAPALVAEFSGLRFPQSVEDDESIGAAVAQGVVFVSGVTDESMVPCIRYYANGAVGELWRADTAANSPVPLTAYSSGLAFVDPTTDKVMYYNPASGGISSIADLGAGSWYALAGNSSQLVAAQPSGSGSTAAKGLTGTDTIAAAATITSSLIDFDSSLTKAFRGITVEWDDDASDTGATVDIAYRVGDVDGSYTTLQTGAVSGTEYTLAGVTGKSISTKVTLNKSGSTLGPALKRVRVRAVPMRQPFRKDQAILNCQGRDGSNIHLRDGATHVKDGKAMATDLRTAVTSTTPITIIDTFGSYTGIIESLELIEVRPEEFLARVTFREV